MTQHKLLMSAILGLMPRMDLIDEFPKAQTTTTPRRYKHPSEIEMEKKDAKCAEIAAWNAKAKK